MFTNEDQRMRLKEILFALVGKNDSVSGKKGKRWEEDKENEGRKSPIINEEGRSEFQSLTNSKSKRRRASYNKFEVVKTANSV